MRDEHLQPPHQEQTALAVALKKKAQLNATVFCASDFCGKMLLGLVFAPARYVAKKSALVRRLVQRSATKLPRRIRNLLLDDSSAALEIYAGLGPTASLSRGTLIVSHDLSASGAPKIVYELARILLGTKQNVTVLSPVDGPFRSLLQQAGANVVIGPQVLDDSAFLTELAAAADTAICNTVVTHRAVRLISPVVPTFWYLHEVSLLRAQLELSEVRATLSAPKQIWAGSELSAALIRPHRSDVQLFPYGLDPLATDNGSVVTTSGPLNIALFGSFEMRKGQDLALTAVGLLPPNYRSRLRLKMFGRVLAKTFHQGLLEIAAAIPEVEIHGELDYEAYRKELLAADAVLLSSRDDTLPLVSLDALGSGRLLLCTKATGTSAYLTHGVSGFVADEAAAASIAAMLAETVDRQTDWPSIGAAGRGVFQANFSRAAFAEALMDRLDCTDRENGGRAT